MTVAASPQTPTFSVAQAAQRLGVQPRAIYRRIRAGRLPAVKVGRRWLVPADALDRFERSASNGAEGEPVAAPPAGRAHDATARVATDVAPWDDDERLRLAAQVAGFGTYDDRGPGRVYWSPELKALFGLPPDIQPDQGAGVALALIHPDDRERWLKALEAARDPNGSGDIEVEHRVVRPDGRVIWVAQKGRILFEGQGAERRGVRAVGVVVDITARKEAEAEREELLAREQAALAAARQALAARDEFLGSVSHDLRTPLTSIRGLAQLLARHLRRLDLPPEARLLDQAAAIDRAAGAMATMVDELLDLTRLEAGQPLELRREPVDLVALARSCAEEQGRTAPRHRIRLIAAAPALVGRWDPGRLERVLGNLLSNAVKYSPEGGEVEVSIRLVRASDARWAELVVADHGIGIPAVDLPHVFERFRRGANAAGRIGGAGLGLAGARRIVEQHGGSIAVASEEGAGTTVTVRLPLDEASPGREAGTA